MLVWHNDPNLKAEVSARMLQHRIEDGIVQGLYQDWDPDKASQYRGCLIGCTLPMRPIELARYGPAKYWIAERGGWHEEVERLYGISTVLGHFFDGLFESLPTAKAAWFAVSVIEAIPVGADLSGVPDLIFQDMVAMAKRGRKEFAAAMREEYSEADYLDEWLNHARADYLDTYEDSTTHRKRSVELAEKVLVHLANAPVPGETNQAQVTLQQLEEVTKEALASVSVEVNEVLVDADAVHRLYEQMIKREEIKV